MTDREKLENMMSAYLDVVGETTAEDMANFLVANGVTVKEPQKPLKVEELNEGDVLWFELDDYPAKYVRIRELIGLSHGFASFQEIGNKLELDYLTMDYGKLWRCWAEKPTEEERMAVEWES